MIEPVTLKGRFVRLEPLTLDHVPALTAVGLDPELWRWIPTPVTSAEEMRAYVQLALDERARGDALPFATIDLASGRAIGSTRYASIALADRRLEIGWTWVAKDWQRTPVNTEAKYLLLGHAFETLWCVRVEFKTDALNTKSRQALTRIGAVEEGTFRNHMVMPGGRIRHSVYFSITSEDWPAVKAHLEARMAAYTPSLSGRKPG